MNINIKTNKNFATIFNKMCDKYGEEFEKLNGLSGYNLSYGDFIDGFVDSNTVADATIDGNANAGTKDICSLEAEMDKPQSKLLAFNKIYYEMNKKYGFKTANEWFETEWNGGFYLHDAPSSSFKPYCILPKECCLFILNGKKIYSSLEQIYDLLPEKEEIDEINLVCFKRPKNLMVQDKNNTFTKVLCVSNKETDKDFYFTKLKNGQSIITTEDHQIICVEGDIPANQLTKENTVYSFFDKDCFTNSIQEYNGLELTEDMGYLIGMYAAEGYNSKGQLSICQSKEKSPKEWEKIISILEKFGIPYNIYKENTVIRLKNGDNNWERKILKILEGKYCNEKRLCPDFIGFNEDFLRGFLAGIIDGDGTIADHRTCMIRMTSRTLINQIRLIGLYFGVYFADRTPYLQNQTGNIKQKKPMYADNINMNRNREFFLSLPSRKILENFTHFDYDEKFANNNYVCELGENGIKDIKETYHTSDTVFDLSTESHTFVCNGILVHNCYAYDLDQLAEKGLFFIKDFNAAPPEHLTTFTDFVGEFVSWTSNRTSGKIACRFNSFPVITGVAYCG